MTKIIASEVEMHWFLRKHVAGRFFDIMMDIAEILTNPPEQLPPS